MQQKRMRNHIKKLYQRGIKLELNGMGVIEIILVLVVIISLVVIFRNQITQIVNNIFTSITSDTSNILGSPQS